MVLKAFTLQDRHSYQYVFKATKGNVHFFVDSLGTFGQKMMIVKLNLPCFSSTRLQTSFCPPAVTLLNPLALCHKKHDHALF